MKFLYKIWSGYNRFTPARIPARLEDGNHLRLVWTKYLDQVTRGDDVWIFFHGPGGFGPGVYAEARASQVDLHRYQVVVRVLRYSTKDPLTDNRDSERAAQIVAPRYRQVFLLPEDWTAVSECSVFSTGGSCGKRKCDWCSTWQGLPRIGPGQLRAPDRIGTQIDSVIPAYWAIPSRCKWNESDIKTPVRQSSYVLHAFKTGNENLAYPLARGMFEALRDNQVDLAFDAIVPIPLSPDKLASGEIHRTLRLAKELSELIDVPVREALSLNAPISKRRMLSDGASYSRFEGEYRDRLVVESEVMTYSRVLLVDDVSTRGSTLKTASRALRDVNPKLKIVAVVAAQMILVAVVVDEATILSA